MISTRTKNEEASNNIQRSFHRTIMTVKINMIHSLTLKFLQEMKNNTTTLCSLNVARIINQCMWPQHFLQERLTFHQQRKSKLKIMSF